MIITITIYLRHINCIEIENRNEAMCNHYDIDVVVFIRCMPTYLPRATYFRTI